jgi:hypothetical protein
MNITNLIPSPWVILAAVLAIAGAYIKGHVDGDDSGAARIQAAWTKADNDLLKWRMDKLQQTRKDERELQAAADKEKEALRAQNDKLDSKYRAAMLELRNRPERPKPGAPGVPAVAGAGTPGWGTGAGLYRDDSEFLVGRADIAQRIRNQRDACYRQYEAARLKAEAANAVAP